ncbi:hypothetical protein EMIT0P253_40297 [Pseudomonas sp. IT-P253]
MIASFLYKKITTQKYIVPPPNPKTYNHDHIKHFYSTYSKTTDKRKLA